MYADGREGIENEIRILYMVFNHVSFDIRSFAGYFWEFFRLSIVCFFFESRQKEFKFLGDIFVLLY